MSYSEYFFKVLWAVFVYTLLIFGLSVITALFFNPKIVFIVGAEIISVYILYCTFCFYSFIRSTRTAKRIGVPDETGGSYE